MLINVLSSPQEYLDLPRLLRWVIQLSFTNCSLMYYSTKITAVISLNLHTYYIGLYSHPFPEFYFPHSIYSNRTTTLSLSNHRDNFSPFEVLLFWMHTFAAKLYSDLNIQEEACFIEFHNLILPLVVRMQSYVPINFLKLSTLKLVHKQSDM